jgi:hypothetical protein
MDLYDGDERADVHQGQNIRQLEAYRACVVIVHRTDVRLLNEEDFLSCWTRYGEYHLCNSFLYKSQNFVHIFGSSCIVCTLLVTIFTLIHRCRLLVSWYCFSIIYNHKTKIISSKYGYIYWLLSEWSILCTPSSNYFRVYCSTLGVTHRDIKLLPRIRRDLCSSEILHNV